MKIKALITLQTISLLCAVAFTGGCAGENEVDGEVASAAFNIRDDAPSLRVSESSGDAVMVWADEDGEQLRTLVMTVPGDMKLEVGEPVQIDADSPLLIQLSVGELETMESNGVRIINSRNPTFYNVVGGTVIFDSLSDPVSGWFSVTLADGSVVRGFFSMDGSIR